MSEGTTIQRRFKYTFSAVPQMVLEDHRLSFKAKGIYAYLVGRPDGWKLQVSDLMSKSNDGETAIRTGLQELRDTGYAKLVKIYEGGRIKEWRYEVYDTPDSGKLDVENLDQENPNHLIRKNDSKKETNVDITTERPGAEAPVGRSVEKAPLVNERTRPKQVELFESIRTTREDVEKFVAGWNGRIWLPRIRGTDRQLQAIREALCRPAFRDNYEEAINIAAKSPFLQGKVGKFRMDLDWFLLADNFDKILEGRYLAREDNQQQEQGTHAALVTDEGDEYIQ